MSASRLSVGPDVSAADLIAEWVDRLHAGEADAEAFIAAHPDHADTLRRLLPAVRMMADLSSSADADANVGPDELLGELGDYRIQRELGRGGMGVVYEAEQISLRRRVALKVLPWAAAMDPKQLQRFKNEALAAASLKHDHIVQVYAVGCERGVHYYAMELIDGRSLADMIGEMRQGLPSSSTRLLVPQDASGASGAAGASGQAAPTVPVAAQATRKTGPGKAHYRRVAELVAQAADALEFAHSMGVVHRDIKPANLLLDESGHLWVTDFGLAKLDTAATLTVSGDLMGTLRYMSPEQALAKHGLVDHRTDVYSLGATLYELLTLRPAVDGDDKQDVLRRIAFEEPVAPRKLDKAIPAELETIALKALAKDPAERYATAGEVAEDLRRWTTDRAIKARPPGFRERVARWARRHRSLVGAAAAVLIVTLVGLAAGGVVVWRKEQQSQLALQRALENLRVARDAAGQLLPELCDLLADVPRMEAKRLDLMRHSLRIYQAFLDEHGHDPRVRVEAADAFMYVGDLQERQGQFDAAEASYRSAIGILRPMTGDRPADVDLRRKLGAALNGLGIVYSSAKTWPLAEPALREAVTVRTELAESASAEPDDQIFLAGSCCNLAALLRRSDARQRVREAETLYRQGITLIHGLPAAERRRERARRFLVNMHAGLAALYFDERRNREGAIETARQLEITEGLAADFPLSEHYRASLAGVYLTMASGLDLQLPAGAVEAPGADLDPATAELMPVYERVGMTKETLVRKALDLQTAVVADYPHKLGNRAALHLCARELTGLLEGLGRTDDALAAHRRVMDKWRALAERDPGDAGLTLELARSVCESGRALQRADRWQEAEQAFREGLAAARRANGSGGDAAGREAATGRLEWNLAWCLTARPGVPGPVAAEAAELATGAVARLPRDGNAGWALGLALYRAGRWQEALGALERSQKLRPGDEGWEWFLMAMAHRQLGRPDQARAHLARAVVWLNQRKSQRHELRRFRAEAEDLLNAGEPAPPGPAPPPPS